MVDVFTRLSVEKLRSAVAEDTGKVKSKWQNFDKLGNAMRILAMQSNTSTDDATGFSWTSRLQRLLRI